MRYFLIFFLIIHQISFAQNEGAGRSSWSTYKNDPCFRQLSFSYMCVGFSKQTGTYFYNIKFKNSGSKNIHFDFHSNFNSGEQFMRGRFDIGAGQEYVWTSQSFDTPPQSRNNFISYTVSKFLENAKDDWTLPSFDCNYSTGKWFCSENCENKSSNQTNSSSNTQNKYSPETEAFRKQLDDQENRGKQEAEQNAKKNQSNSQTNNQTNNDRNLTPVQQQTLQYNRDMAAREEQLRQQKNTEQQKVEQERQQRELKRQQDAKRTEALVNVGIETTKAVFNEIKSIREDNEIRKEEERIKKQKYNELAEEERAWYSKINTLNDLNQFFAIIDLAYQQFIEPKNKNKIDEIDFSIKDKNDSLGRTNYCWIKIGEDKFTIAHEYDEYSGMEYRIYYPKDFKVKDINDSYFDKGTMTKFKDNKVIHFNHSIIVEELYEKYYKEGYNNENYSGAKNYYINNKKNKTLSKKENSNMKNDPNLVSNIISSTRDGINYETFEYNKKTWLKKNIYYRPVIGAYEDFENKKSNSEKYGLFYNWEAANVACPEGSRLPTVDEAIDLFLPFGNIGYVDAEPSYKALFGRFNKEANNEAYFNIMSSKDLNFPKIVPSTQYENSMRSMIWTSTPENNKKERYYAIFINNNGNNVFLGTYPKQWKGYCRCIVDDKPLSKSHKGE